MRWRLADLGRVVGACLAASGLAACAGTQDEPASAAAQAFLEAVREKDGRAACELLAPTARAELEDSSGRPCAEAVLEEGISRSPSATPTTVQVYDSMAQVRVDTETLFLSQFDGDWLVVGAACSPKPGDQPYDCSIQVS